MTKKRKRNVKNRLHVKQAGLCSICREPIDMNQRNFYCAEFPTIDHIVPVSRGGPKNSTSNMALAHQGCNVWRGNMPWHYVELYARSA